MGVEFVVWMMLGGAAVLFGWIGNQLFAHKHRWVKLTAEVVGLIVGLAVGNAVNALVLGVLLGIPRATVSGEVLLSLILPLIPFFVIMQGTVLRTAHLRRDYQAAAGFIALIICSLVALGTRYLLHPQSLPGMSSAAFFGYVTGLFVMVLFLRVVYLLALRAANPPDERSAKGSILLP